MVVENIGTIGVKPACVGGVVQGSGICSTSFLVGDMVDDPLHGPGPGEGITGWPDRLQGSSPGGA